MKFFKKILSKKDGEESGVTSFSIERSRARRLAAVFRMKKELSEALRDSGLSDIAVRTEQEAEDARNEYLRLAAKLRGAECD